MQRLADFLMENIEPIVKEWENFACTISIDGKPLDSLALRDHAEWMLRAIAADLGTAQSAEQQIEKSQWHGPSADDSAAKSHAVARLMAGFSLDQVVSEFRALRASVISLWMKKLSAGESLDIKDMIRFNEAVDQALSESVSSYTTSVQASRNIFLGILGHDLRTPLNAILLGSDVLLRTDDLGERATKITSRIYASVKRATRIVADLLDFTRSQVGPGIPIKRELRDIAPACTKVVDESRTVYPEANITLSTQGPVEGWFDVDRLEQAFSNLITNAVQHGAANMPVSVTLNLSQDAAVFSVHNQGRSIPEEVLPYIFNPMGRFSPQSSADYGPYASMGLGLFIVSQVVKAHEGHVSVVSGEATGTLFTVRIPVAIPSN
jgi:signal transduction histidine kinase